MEPSKRAIAYSTLDIPVLIPILKKFTQMKDNGTDKIRELKKKEVESIVKKLEMQLK